MKPDPDWVVLAKGEPARYECRRCGDMRIPKVPAPVDDFVRECQEFVERHSKCAPREASEA